MIEAISRPNSGQIVLAALFVAMGYFTLTFYDWFAVRAIGRGDITYRINALAAFTSYSIGHNVGASVFTGGAVRYRIYSAWGLNAIDVAKICFLAGLTFWLGNAAVLGLGIAYHPEAASSIDQLPPWLNRIAAILIILALVAYVVWVWTQPRVVGRGPWTVVLPGGPLTLLQIAIGIVDLGFCALAMYVLVPDEPNLGFVVVAVIFVSATLLGFAAILPAASACSTPPCWSGCGRWTAQRRQMLMFFARLPSAVVGMEACGAAHHWARKLRKLGHEVRLMTPQHVKAYVKRNKNDGRDRGGIRARP